MIFVCLFNFCQIIRTKIFLTLLFIMTAIKNYHKLRGINNTYLWSQNSVVQMSRCTVPQLVLCSWCHKAEIKVLELSFSLEPLGMNTFQVCPGCWKHSVPCGCGTEVLDNFLAFGSQRLEATQIFLAGASFPIFKKLTKAGRVLLMPLISKFSLRCISPLSSSTPSL